MDFIDGYNIIKFLLKNINKDGVIEINMDKLNGIVIKTFVEIFDASQYYLLSMYLIDSGIMNLDFYIEEQVEFDWSIHKYILPYWIYQEILTQNPNNINDILIEFIKNDEYEKGSQFLFRMLETFNNPVKNIIKYPNNQNMIQHLYQDSRVHQILHMTINKYISNGQEIPKEYYYILANIMISYDLTGQPLEYIEETRKFILKYLDLADGYGDSDRLFSQLFLSYMGFPLGTNLGFEIKFDIDTFYRLGQLAGSCMKK